MIYQNYQLYCECQLVALWNAGRFHGLEVPKPGTRKYREACRRARAIYGGCLDLEPERQRLGLRLVPGFLMLGWVRKNLPVHFAIFCHRGYHSVLAVEVRGSRVLLTNYAKGRVHWIDWWKLAKKTNVHTRPYSILPLRRNQRETHLQIDGERSQKDCCSCGPKTIAKGKEGASKGYSRFPAAVSGNYLQCCKSRKAHS